MPTAATFYVLSADYNKAMLRVELGEGYPKFRIFCRLSSSSSAVVHDKTVSRTADFNYVITGLQPDTEYTVNICSVPANGQGGVWAGAETFVTGRAPAPVRPANWAWWTDVRAGVPVAFTAEEFQAFYDRINAFRVYKFGAGSEWPNFVPVSKGVAISAKMMQEVTAAIQPMTAAAMPPIPTAGKTVITADYFNKLKEYLNSVE